MLKANFKKSINSALKSFHKTMSTLETINAKMLQRKTKNKKIIDEKEAENADIDLMTENNNKILINIKGILNVNSQTTKSDSDDTDR